MASPTRLLPVLPLVCLLLPGAAAAAGSVRSPVEPPSLVRPAADKVFRLANPLPFPVQIRILGDGPGFPQVRMLPAPPAPPVPIPYPNTVMRIQVKKPDGKWSTVIQIGWKPGPIAVPGF